MDSRKVLYSKGGNDECMTPSYAIYPILKYIPKNLVIWCPFDKKDSEFVKVLSKSNEVIYSHIENGEDFYNYEPENLGILLLVIRRFAMMKKQKF